MRNVDEEQFDKAMRNAKRRELEMRRVMLIIMLLILVIISH